MMTPTLETTTAALSTEPPTNLRRLDLEKIAKAYDSEPWWYDLRGLFILTFSYRSTLWDQLRFFGANIRSRHLEVAIGSGTLLDYVLGWRRRRRLVHSRIDGFDYADSMLAGAVRRFREHPEIALDRADAANVPYANDTFDSINIANALHCIPDVDGALREMYRVLQPGGSLAMNVLLDPRGSKLSRALAARINAWGQKKGILHAAYDEEDIRARVRAAGFQDVNVTVKGNTCHFLVTKPARYRG